VAEALLRGPSLYIHLDPRKPDVIVPPYFKKQPQLVLQVGLNMAIPIPDLKVDDEGVTCTLSFNRKPFWCRLPWSAVFALVGEDMKGMVWPDEVPAEVAAQRDSKAPASTEPKSPRARAAAREGGTRRRTAPEAAPQKKLAVVSGAAAASSGSSSPSSPPSGGPAQPSLPFASSPPTGQPRAPSPSSTGAQAAREGDTPTQPGTPREAAKPGKRELPPYLRVVK